MYRYTVRSTIKALVCLVLVSVPAGAGQRDMFTDGSSRSGPEFADIPGGDYLLGSAPEEPSYFPHDRRRLVALSPFALATREVTNDEFVEFLNERGGQDEQGLPWVPRHEGIVFLIKGSKFTVRKGMGRKPAVSVSWAGARAYARWLSEKTGRRYELPTAAQWEAGARGGSTTAWWWGDAFEPGRVALGTAAIDAGSYPPNAYGLYDTAGNAWEWTLDCLQFDAHTFAPRQDPSFVIEDCGAPEIRGGSFRDGAEAFRSGRRLNYWSFGPNDSVGFRLAREPETNLPVVSVTPTKPKPATSVVPGLELTLDTPPTDVPLAFMLFIPGYPVRHAKGGATLLVPLPAGEKVTFIVKEADLGSSVERTVTIRPDKPTRIRLTGKDFSLPARGKRTLTGRVLRPDHTPVKGALVVLSDYPDRHETHTDGEGLYRFGNVREGHHALLVDARDTGLPKDYSPVLLKRGELSSLSSIVLKPSRPSRLGDGLGNAAVHDDDRSHWVKIDDIGPAGNPDANRLRMTIPEPGRYTVYWAKSPLYVFTGGGELNAGSHVIEMRSGRELIRSIGVLVLGRNDHQVSVPVYISSFAEDPAPYELDSFDAGYAYIGPVNVPDFNAWVDDEQGCFDGLVRVSVQEKHAIIRLNPPGTCYDDERATLAPGKAPPPASRP